MNEPEPNNPDTLKEYIIDRLGRGVAEDDLLLVICQRANIPWEQARQLVERIRDEDAQVIGEHQLPWRIILALVIGIGGLGMVIGASYYLIGALALGQSLINGGPGNGSLPSGNQAAYLYNTAVNQLPTILTMLGTGLAMLFGTALGMRDTWRVVINWLGDRL